MAQYAFHSFILWRQILNTLYTIKVHMRLRSLARMDSLDMFSQKQQYDTIIYRRVKETACIFWPL